MKPRFLDTGPPLQKVDATGSNRGTSRSRYQPDAASESLHFRLWRQVHTNPVGLVHLEKALSLSAWYRLGAAAVERRVR